MSFYFNKFLSHSFLTVGLYGVRTCLSVSPVFSVKIQKLSRLLIKVPVDFLDENNGDLKPRILFEQSW